MFPILFFEAVGLLAYIDDLSHPNVPPLQQTDCLPAARLAFGVGALRPRMEFIFT